MNLKRHKPQNIPRKNDSTNSETKKIYDVPESFKNYESSINGLSTNQAKERLEKYGRNEIVEKKESKWKKILKLFSGPIPLMIEIAALLSFIVAIVNSVIPNPNYITWASFALVLVLLISNATIDYVQSSRAATALDSLKKSMALKAQVKRDGKFIEINAAELVPGDIVKIANGDILPADLIMVEGDLLQIDQAAMTGESLPVNKYVGYSAYSSTIAKQGNAICLITRTGRDTFFGQTVDLIQNSKTKSQFKESITKIGRYLIGIAFLLVVVLLIYLSVETFAGSGITNIQNEFLQSFTIIETLLAVIIAAIPVAMPSVLSVTTVIGAKELAQKKAIVNKLDAIQELSGVNILCSDKTGTLTQNKLSLNKIDLLESKDEEEVKRLGILATNYESTDAIDSLFLKLQDLNQIKTSFAQLKYTPFNAEIKRTEAIIKDVKTNKEFKVIKGASLVLINLSSSSKDVKDKATRLVEDYAEKGIRTLAIAKEENGNILLQGIISFVDPLRIDSIEVVKKIQELGISVKMLTGDDEKIAKYNAELLGIGSAIYEANSTLEDPKYKNNLKEKEALIEHASGFARVFPQHKYEIVKLLQEKNEIVAMTGDGVNDSPALKQSDVGFAVDGATDAAKDSADIILTEPGLGVIVGAIKQSREIFRRMTNYINYRIALSLSIIGIITLMTFILGVSPLTPIMVILIALFDDIPIMTIAFDKVKGNDKPTKLSVKSVFSRGSLLGIVVIVETLIMYLLTAYTPLFNVLQQNGVLSYNSSMIGTNTTEVFNNAAWLTARTSGGTTEAIFLFQSSTIQSILFLTIVISVQFMLFIARTDRWFWEKPYPDKKLALTIILMQIIAILLVGLINTKTSPGQFIQTLSWSSIAFIWIFCVVFAFISNFLKIVEGKIKMKMQAKKQKYASLLANRNNLQI